MKGVSEAWTALLEIIVLRVAAWKVMWVKANMRDATGAICTQRMETLERLLSSSRRLYLLYESERAKTV